MECSSEEQSGSNLISATCQTQLHLQTGGEGSPAFSKSSLVHFKVCDLKTIWLVVLDACCSNLAIRQSGNDRGQTGSQPFMFWQTGQLARMLQGEMRQGLGYFHETICPALPLFYRRIDTALKQVSWSSHGWETCMQATRCCGNATEALSLRHTCTNLSPD